MVGFALFSGISAFLVYAICGDPSPDADMDFICDRN